MSASTGPTEGVVDQNLKVHGVDNLYVGGASVFASAGISNPTMTIITLSIRLAEHSAYPGSQTESPSQTGLLRGTRCIDRIEKSGGLERIQPGAPLFVDLATINSYASQHS